MNGFLVIDKPAGVTSHDVVAAVRAVSGVKKVGHTGTLDPFATGVLALALGVGTRLIEFLDESHKVYDATIALGRATDTGDPTGETIEEQPVPSVTEAQVQELLATFKGEHMQRPPPYSAVKHQGKPLYWYARRGERIEVPARPIQLHALQLIHLEPGEVRVRIHCGPGTYARVLAEEIAQGLGTVGHLSALTRERSGPFRIEDAMSVQELAALVSSDPGQPWDKVLLQRSRGEDRVPWRPRGAVREGLNERMTPLLGALSHLPMVEVKGRDARQVRNGHVPSAVPGALAPGDLYLVVDGPFVLAVAEMSGQGPRLRKVIPVA